MAINLEKCSQNFKLYLKSIDDEQVFLTASIINKEKSSLEMFQELYVEVAKILNENGIVIFHERIFGSISLYEHINKIRNDVLSMYYENCVIPYTLIEGNPYWGEGISGINIHGIIIKNSSESISNIEFENKICGRIWKSKRAEILVLNSIHGLNSNNDDNYNQTLNMFEKASYILKQYGFEFNNVIRTWIYLHDILEQYSDFNKARNIKFKEFKMIPGEIDDNQYEHVYMPASTGIDCNNPFGAAGIMDVLAIKKSDDFGVQIHNITGVKQKSAYRYGSAFSRAMVIDDQESKYVYLSGTASINDKGETVYLDDIKKQIEMTGSVIETLTYDEGLNIRNICEGTVFLKKAEYIDDYKEYCHKNNLELPCIITVANVCRDDLLFEIDATLMGKSTRDK